ncbi:hypothetical protein Patl1_37375 [Pistacia atlantica]|nr:hypothetical protein Patl1_37375 [Pistacia atlantica]
MASLGRHRDVAMRPLAIAKEAKLSATNMFVFQGFRVKVEEEET